MYSNSLDQYSEILEKLEGALAEIVKADLHFGLTDVQGQSFIQLKQIYDAMADDANDLERELL